MLNLVIFGAPGSGKGTQSERLIDRYGLYHISTGELLRDHIARGTELGKIADSYISKGNLIPDELMLQVLEKTLDDNPEETRNGVIFDGFPRTIPQAEALDRMGVDIDRVIDIEVPDDTIARRVSGRRVCLKCGATYHMDYKRPQVDGVCDKCGDTLVQRKDDQPETVIERLRVYHESTEPLVAYYRAAGKLCVVEGQEKVEDTTALVFRALGV